MRGCALCIPALTAIILLGCGTTQTLQLAGFRSDFLLEASCPEGSGLEDVAAFVGSRAFPRELVSRMQASTVRISFKPKAEMDDVVRKEFGLQHFDLKSFAAWGNEKKGACTGTVIDQSLIITAGHCFSPSNYYEEGQFFSYSPPVVLNEQREFVRYLAPAELARLFKVDFNYQKAFVASMSGVAPEYAPYQFSLPVVELADFAFEDPRFSNSKDYAVIRVRDPGARVKGYAIGWSKIAYRTARNSEDLAVIQHPRGGYKQISVGTTGQGVVGLLNYPSISTEGGSSGAGLLAADGTLIGIHTRGGCDREEPNRGVHVQQIAKQLRALQKSEND